MLYSVRVDAGVKSILHAGCTQVMVQNILTSYFEDAAPAFKLTVTQEVHQHRWYCDERYIHDDLRLMCDGCNEEFKISQTILQAFFTGEERARQNGC